ncbi:SusC/RagA family TonB-linked outer membrane protein [Chitinophaga cymbidii]|uniref:SusC/RagA family TonB-linked outer membrane protein n=1 Tax=Chitinophaga cymbidii TaxID=1096750 RepID=A0A512RPB6_9BACT|nr:SusC/RagA family TonB-linked outer membrane protein [Chitinophaga cymbidii]GEP97531.1 SusC/RagA family TonB-linked outer membrane protein [Chitinophaga cymbidii]
MNKLMVKKILYSIITILAVAADSSAQSAKKPVVLLPLPKDSAGPVVETGYATLPATSYSGAAAAVSGNTIEHSLTPNFKSALQGRLAGVHIAQANGMPASEVTVRVRGTSSIYAETAPLYVIDGVPVYSGPREVKEAGIAGNWGATFNPLVDINPDDIESIEVLKDAAATAIYGSRGGNGVIVVTTRSGKGANVGRDDVRLHYYYGVTSETNRVNSLNGPQYLNALDKAWVNSGGAGEAPFPTASGLTRGEAENTSTDHVDRSLEPGNVQHVSLSSGYHSGKTSFYFSGSYHKEKGILTGNDLVRYTGKIKVTNQVTRRLSIGLNAGMNYVDYFNMPTGYSTGGGFNAAQRNLPVYPFMKSGKYFFPSDPAIYNLPGSNVTAFQDKANYDNEEHTRRVFIAANITYDIMPGLDLRLDAAMDQYYHTRRDYLSRFVRFGSVGSGNGREGVPTAYAGYEKYSENVYNIRGTLNYKKKFKGHQLTGVAGFEFYYNDNPYFFAEGEGFVSDYLRQPAMASFRNAVTPAALVTNVNSFAGYFGSAQYAWKEKFLAGATLRVDGSSRFGANQKYHVFPAASVGYVLSEEHFLKSVSAVNYLRIRASYGRTGNAGIGNYSSLERWALTNSSRYLLQAGVHAAGFGSPALEPEKQDQFNIGIDLGLFNDRISAAIDFYNNTTRDLILSYNAPPSAGVVDPGLWLNTGSLRNRGVELSLVTRNLVGAFKWTTELNIARNKNTVLDLGGASVASHPNIAVYEGKPLGVFYLAEYAGTDPVTGAELIYDLDRNKVPATSAAQIDAARIPHYDKPSAPKFFGGLNNTFTFRDFDLGAFLTFSYGNYILDEGERELSYLKGNNNLRESAVAAGAPRLLYNDPVAGSNTTRFLHDASYLRMRNLTLGYSFNRLLKNVKFVRNARLYVSAQNLFTITGFSGWDPEVAGMYGTSLERNLNQGITYMDLPQVRTFATGFNLNF